MIRNLLIFLTVAMAVSCSNAPRVGETTMARKLGAQLTGKMATETIAYVVRFDSIGEAEAHAKIVKAQGGTTKPLNAEGTVLSAKVERAALDKMNINESSIASLNTPIRLVRPAAAASATAESSQNAEQAILEALTVRKVTGVDRLVARFPEADGRGVKVAVFDTGIDFGVEGVSTNGKLQGFYDLTGFGKVETSILAATAPAATYTIGDRTVALPVSLAVRSIQATGILSETALARAYDIAAGVDLNGNGETGDSFPFMIGENTRGTLAVFIDVDGDNSIAEDGSEELTDYNTNHTWVDLYHSPQAPSGGRPLAVTLNSAADVQFHSVPEGHGTSCSIIIAGDGYADGRLLGLAPKATLFSYLLDADGQDFYTMDQFLAMFLHAKAQGIDAISISWGFATADLESARFMSTFLDREIASAGIVIAIAAGNEGPGLKSATGDDYIPRHGFGVGALLSAEQAVNVYGWTGATEDAIVWYSSMGPTRGGRMMPDAASPIISFVRSERGTTPGRFYGFSGTSSATPALIGSVSALMSVLKQHGETTIDARLIKLAVQGTANKLVGTEDLRQGAGVIDVAAAYDLYRTLAAELHAARADATHRTKFAYELKASTPLPGQATPGEGIVSRGAIQDATVTVNFTGETLSLIDTLTTLEPLLIKHGGDFFTTPTVLPLQAGGARFTVQFKAAALQTPGVYTDVIDLARASDGLVLLRVPVSVTVDATANTEGKLAMVDQTISPFAIWRTPIVLTEADEIAFDGVALDLGGNAGQSLFIQVYDDAGHGVASQSIVVDGSVTALKFRSPKLPAGNYEVLINRNFSRPAALGQLKVTGAVRLSKARFVAGSVGTSGVDVALAVRGRVDAVRAELSLTGTRHDVTLTRGIGSLARQGYLTTIELAAPAESIDLALRQSAFDRAMEAFLNVELVLRDHETGAPLYRGWHDLRAENAAAETIELALFAESIDVLAYPNIVDWTSVATTRLNGELVEALPFPVVLSVGSLALSGTGTRLVSLHFEGEAAAGSVGTLTLYGADDAVLETVGVTLP